MSKNFKKLKFNIFIQKWGSNPLQIQLNFKDFNIFEIFKIILLFFVVMVIIEIY